MHADPIRPPTKANSTNRRRGWSHYGLALAVLCMLSVQAVAQNNPCTEVSFCMPTPTFNLSAYYGGQNIKINSCATNTTTPDNEINQCAWADAAVADSDNPQAGSYFLACPMTTTGPIALCYYSGMPGAPYSTPSCTLSQNGKAAECYCYEIANGIKNQPPQTYSFVEISAILNEEVYNEAISQCSMDGSGCLNILNMNKPSPPAPANICAYLNKTNPTNLVFAGADLISDFSEIPIPNITKAGYMPPGETGDFPPQTCSGNYAACMTAPCKFTNKTDPATGWPLAKCTCPTFNGPNQVGNAQIGMSPSASRCSPTPYVWSSANTQTN